MPQKYDTTVARQEFDYFTRGWRSCAPAGLLRVRHQLILIAEHLPKDDPRHLVMNEILEKIAGRETP
jgi:hypothetical protein